MYVLVLIPITTNTLHSFGKCGSWSFDHSTSLCYLHDSDGCCNQFNKREKDDNFISGYVCSVCWSTKNECPCNKQDRERDSYVGFNFASGSVSKINLKSTIVLKFIKKLKYKFISGKTQAHQATINSI